MIRLNAILLTCVVAAVAALSPSVYGKDSDALEFTKDSLSQVKSNVAEGKAILVDVRDLVEWNSGHVRDAIHLPWRDLQGKKSDQLVDKLPKDKIVYTYCAAIPIAQLVIAPLVRERSLRSTNWMFGH
jgi:hypothetical protein